MPILCFQLSLWQYVDWQQLVELTARVTLGANPWLIWCFFSQAAKNGSPESKLGQT